MTNYFVRIFKASPWLLIAMCGPIVMHIYWESAYLLRDTIPVLMELVDFVFPLGLLFLMTPVMIAVCLVVFRVPVRSIARDTLAVAVGFVVGDVIAYVLLLPTNYRYDFKFALHLSFGALFLAVCIPAAAVMFSLAVAYQRKKGKGQKGVSDGLKSGQ